MTDSEVLEGKGRQQGVPPWLALGTSAEAIARIRGHPAFDAALASAAEGLTGLYQGHRLLNRVMNDRGRALFALLALYLDASPDAAGTRLTAGRMVAVCAETELCSRGRAKAMLALLRFVGHLEPGPDAGDRRVRQLVPTAALWALVGERWRRLYEAIALVRPEGAEALAALARPSFASALAVALGASFHHGFRVLQEAPELGLPAERDGGLMILLAIFLAEQRAEPVPTIAALARRFQVSRAQVLGLIRDAEARGLVGRAAPAGEILLLPPLRESIAVFFAAVFALLAAAAGHALETERR